MTKVMVVGSPATGLDIFDLHTIPKPTVAVLLMPTTSSVAGSLCFSRDCVWTVPLPVMQFEVFSP